MNNNLLQANIILNSIGQAKLTDEEAQDLPTTPQEIYVYYYLARVLNQRGTEGQAIEKLNAAALLAGYNITLKKDKTPTSVLVGAVLD